MVFDLIICYYTSAYAHHACDFRIPINPTTATSLRLATTSVRTLRPFTLATCLRTIVHIALVDIAVPSVLAASSGIRLVVAMYKNDVSHLVIQVCAGHEDERGQTYGVSLLVVL
jgi:hypothetical protein